MNAPRPIPARTLLRSLCTAAVLAALPATSQAQPAAAFPQPGATQKVCQLTGETDKETGLPTLNRTASRQGFWGTDLGSSFEHEGRLFFLFGDTHAVPGLQRKRDRDMIAVTQDTDPTDCVALSFGTLRDGGYAPMDIPGVDGGEFSVPTGGFSADGRIYVIATTGHSPGNPMERSVLARSDDEGKTFSKVRDLSTSRFINVAPVPVTGGKGLPGPGVLMFASGRYRASVPVLGFLPEGGVEAPGAMRYFAGLDGRGEPRWGSEEAEAKPLFDEACLGELSVTWNAPLGKWLMLYNCAVPTNKIFMRTAERPWGPWSEPETLFDPRADGGFCRYMNAPNAACAPVADAHTPKVEGDPYGPYVIDRFTKAEEGGAATIYFTMSTWNPYNVVLMRATLRPRGGQVADQP